MAKNKNVRIVNRKKNTKRKSYADEKKLSFTPEVKSVFWTCLVVAIVLGVFYLITIKATGGSIFKKDEEDKEVEFQYSEILVGRSFDLEGDYYVLYYDMSDTESDDYEILDNAIHEFEGTMGGSNFYKCDLSNAFNKPFVTTNEPNENPISADDMLLTNPTLIRFSDGHVLEYIYGFEDVENYMTSNNE
ncbi:MAG: hypothetical protein IKH54_04500 [Bacilli bacterium]|nr:hypothetical protein [Bacilli bacterium]